MKEVLKLRKRRTGQWVTVAGMVLIGACMTIGNTVVFADDTQTYPIEVSDSNKFNLTDSPSPLSSENLGTNNRGHEVATLPSTGHVDSSAKTTPEYLMSESSTVSLVKSDVATTETSTSVLASLSEVAPTKSTDSSETLVPSTLSEDPKHASTSEGAAAEVKSHSETLVEHSTNSNNEEESGDNLIYDIHNQEVTITDIKRKETIKKLIIPQRISNYRVTEIGSSAFSGSSLKEVVLPSTLTQIGSSAFSGTQLKDITLPTSVTTIGSGAFGSIDSLSSVVIPKNLSNAYRAFEGSQHLKTIHFEEGITKIADGLFKDSGISSITIPKTVTEIGYEAFRNTRITELYIPDSVTKLGANSFGTDYYNDFKTLTKVSLPSELQSTSSPFYGQKNLKEVVLRGNWKTIPGGLFSGTGIEKLVIPEGVTEIGADAFSGSSLKEVVLPKTLTKIGDSAFSGTQLTNMSVPSSVREIGSYAFNSTPLEVINLPYGLQVIGSGAFRNTKLETIEIPEGVTYLDDYTLANIPTLKSVYLPKSLTAFVQSWNTPSESVEYHVYLDSFALEYMIEKQLNFKLRDENVANDDSKVLDSSNSYYLTTTTGTRRQGYLGLDLKYAIKKDKSSDDGKYVLHLNIPSTTKVFESKIRVNGQDVTATVSNGYLDIPVSEEIGKIKLMLMTENRELTNVRLFAQFSYQKDRKKVSENIGAINVNIPVLTLTANQVTSRSYSRISGIADPNDQLIAYLDDMVVGQVKIKKDGSYTFDVPLVTPVDNKEYTIKVKALSSDGREISETTTVRYEKNYPELVNFIMRHNGYTYNLKENQDKVPVISFRPGGKFDFEVEYTNTEQIENIYLVSVREGIKKYVQLYYDENLKKYIYHGYFDEKNTSYVPGKLELQIINKEKRIPSILIELEGKKIDYLSSDFKEKYKIIDELNRDKFVTRIINRETQKVVLTEEISIDILKELFDNIQNNSESQPKTSSILVKEEENNLGFRSAEGTKGEPILNLFYALLLEGAGNINLNQFFSPAKFALEELFKIPELIFRKYAGLSKDLSTVSDSVFDGIVDKQLGNKAIKDEFAKVPGLEKVVNNIGLYQELGTFVMKWSMLELLEQLLENPKLVIQGNYKYNALQTIKREKNNFINASTLSIGVSLASNSKHVALGALIYDFGATFYNFIRGIGGKLEKWERIPTVSGLPESIYENIIDDLKIGAPTLTNWKVKTPSNNTKEEDIGTKAYSNSFDVSNLFSVRYTTPHNNLSRFTTFNIPAFQFVVDPSGIVINNVSKKPVTGATINLYYQGENGEEILWDAGEYSQFNPLLTTVNGEYAWDVPEGFWKVKVSKEGYESAESDWLPVPPPQTEVHFNLKPLSYKIAYKVGDGILKEDVPRSYQTDVDTELPYPVRKGYVFTGWYLDDNFSGEPFFNTLFDKAGDKVLYAKWEKDTKILSDDDNVVTVTVSGNDVNVIGKVVKKEVTNADILEKVGDHNNLLMEIQALDDDGNVVSLSEDAEIELAVISGQKPYKVLHYVKDKSTFEEVPFNWNEKDKNISLTTSTLGVYLIQNKLTEKQMTSKVRQESRVLKTDKIEYVDDSSLDAGKVREVAAINGKVLVEITDVYVNGELQSSTEKELSRIEPQAKKVYRGTKQVSHVPDVAPMENNKPEAIIETKVRQESRVLKTDKIEYVDDSSLDAGKVREVAAINGKVLIEITDIYVNSELQLSTERELSRIEPQAKKVYRGTKWVSQVPDVAPIEVNRIERNNITKEHPGVSIAINTKLEPVVMNQSSSEPLSSKETTIRTKGYLPNTSSEYSYGFELAGIIALATAHFGIISNKRKKNIKN
ncbi:leucine-rich repeat protein [Streptococcus oralis]|uniref:Putative lipoprotein n=1 Tax=Streptococcus mitis bv. 2 str. F0392 TaxID=768726 RepID=F9P0W6_STROR|nr:leucine-rich repeat protein [Streptococcus mitis]EGR94131.1 putative lipoprotein [Streptococcus mitis bv. 2 str. F0392]